MQSTSGYVYKEGIYGLLQAGILPNQLLKKHLAKYGYYKVPHTPGLWKHHTSLIKFTLVADYLGIEYINKSDIEYLLIALKTNKKLK